MIELAPTTDMQLVRQVFTHPEVWPFVCDDGSDDVDAFAPAEHASVHYLAARLDGEVCGCLMVHPVNSVLFELHSAMLPHARGAGSMEVARQLLAWLWDSTPARKLITWVPANNIAAASGARRAGFVEEGRLSAAYLKGGELHDLILFGVSKCL